MTDRDTPDSRDQRDTRDQRERIRLTTLSNCAG